ncbi:MAG: site-specific integrase [Bacteroides sp.]|nr:site-specific integrase [Bacteroides sp.]
MKDLTSFTVSVLRELEDEGRFSTAHVYRSTLRSFSRYWAEENDGNSIPLRETFTPASLERFERHLQSHLLKLNTQPTYLRMLRALYYRALRMGLVGYVPGLFDRVYTGTRSDVKRALPPVGMGRILEADVSACRELEEVQVWFALLFLLRGMPFADLARLRKCDLQGSEITYCRRKTGKTLTVRLTPDAATLIRCCADRHPDSPYLLDILWHDAAPRQASIGSREEYLHYCRVLRSFNRRLKLLAQRLNIKEPLSSYTARHTWATTAYHRKCATGIISQALGHSSVKVTETYLKPFADEEMDKTNRKIIHYVKASVVRIGMKK